jgi:Tol biopolymer transport system component
MWLAPRIERMQRLSELQQLKVVPLTALPGNVWFPSFSPDGNQIAFVWHDDTYAPGGNLYAKVIGTAEPLQITHDAPGVSLNGAAYSPDGKYIAICRGPGLDSNGVFLISALGGPLRKLTSTTCQTLSGNGFAWSPDGKQLVFHHRHANSPSDRTIRLFMLSLDSMTEVPVKSDCNWMTAPAFSPRGDYLAWACMQRYTDNAIYVQRLSDGSTTQLVRGLEGVGGLAWSADGRRIVFSSPGGATSDTGGDLWEVALARPNRPEKLPFGHDASELAVSFAGHRLAFKQVHINVNIWRVDLSQPAAPAQKIVVSCRKQNSPNYSPDGKHIAFDSNRSGNIETWVSDADGSNALQLTSFGVKLGGTPRWSPDGTVIALDSRAEGEANIYLVDPRGGVPRKLEIDIRDNTMPTWSHDGAWIYFTSGHDAKGDSSVWKVPSKGGHAIQLSKGYAYTPQQSPDGQYVYFSRNWWLWRVKTDGTDEQQVEGMPRLRGLEAWTPFGSGIYFLGSADGKSAINFFDLKTKEVRPVHYLEKPAPIWLGGLPISSDGRWLLLPLLEDASSDLMLVENWH